MEKEENLDKSIREYFKLINKEVSDLEEKVGLRTTTLFLSQAAEYTARDSGKLVLLFKNNLQKNEIINFIENQNIIHEKYPESVEIIRKKELERLEKFGERWFLEYKRNEEIASNLEKYLPYFGDILEKFIKYSKGNKSEVIIESNISQVMAEYPQVFSSYQVKDLFILYLGFVVEYLNLFEQSTKKEFRLRSDELL
jgi:hypothetical protein